LIDPVRAGDDAALCGLAENLRQAHHRHRAGAYDVSQNLTRADRGQLVNIAHDKDGGVVRNCLQQGLQQGNIDHRAFINDQQIALERAFLVALETERFRIDFQHAVDGLRLHSGRFLHPFGSSPGRGAQQ
jgi:hypothetical protein